MTTLEDRIRAGLHDAAERIPERMTTARIPEPPRVPGWVKAVAAAASVLVVIGGVSVFGNGGGPVGADRVVRLALTQDVAALGGVPEVVNSSVSTDGFGPVPGVAVWQWGEVGESAIWLVEAGLDADLAPLLGPTTGGQTIRPPGEGHLESLDLADVDWHGLSWKSGDVWYVVFGFDEAVISATAGQLRAAEVEETTVGGEAPVPIDVRRLVPGPPVELSELFYSSPAGGFSVTLFRGWPHGVQSSLARFGDRGTRITVNGQEAVTFSDEVNSWVMWSVDEDSTGGVESSDLDMETLIDLAESVTSVTLGEWRALTGTASGEAPSTTRPQGDTGFAPLGDNGIVHLTSTQLRDVSEIWGAMVGVEVTDADTWGRRAADVCMLGAWNDDVAEYLAAEYVSQDLIGGAADGAALTSAMEAVWHIAATVCPTAFPEGALEAGPPTAQHLGS